MTKYMYDLHIHTEESSLCGRIPAKEMIRLYHDKGYQGVAVTDHYNKNFFHSVIHLSWTEQVDSFLQGYRIAKDEAKKYDMDVFLGIEFRELSNTNDFLVYGLSEDFLYKYPHLYRLKIEEAVKLFRKNEGVIYQAHPYRSKGSFLSNPDFLDGIEVHNGNSRQSYDEQKTQEAVEKHAFYGISNSDFHIKEDLARGGNVFATPLKNNQDLVYRLKNGRIDELIKWGGK